MTGTDAFTKDLQEHRSYFPALANKAYFNYGGQGVLPKQAMSAVFCSYDYVQTNGPFSGRMLHWLEEESDKTKAAIAHLLNAEAESIALTSSVTEGCNIAMWGCNWKPGDHLLLSDCEHPSIVAIAEQLAARFGIEVGLAPMIDAQIDPVRAIADNITPKTRLVAISHVLWNTGRILPAKEIASMCKSKGVKLLLDGAQSAGVMPIDVADLDCDFYAITGHKWLCGPEGLGALYIRRELLGELLPTYVGWRGVEALERGINDASRFEIATAPFPLFAGLREAINLHNEWAPKDQRWQQVQDNVGYLRRELEKIPGTELVWSGDCAGLVSFTVPGKTSKELARGLENERVMLRSIPYPDCVRASLHYLTNRRDIDRLLAAIS